MLVQTKRLKNIPFNPPTMWT